MPIATLERYAEAMPRIEAERSLAQISNIAIGFGAKNGAEEIQRLRLVASGADVDTLARVGNPLAIFAHLRDVNDRARADGTLRLKAKGYA